MSSSAMSDSVKNLICIEYPGNVKSVPGVLETLGGIQKISKVYSESNSRLELRFRPADEYCKPVCGDRHNATALVIKVKRNRRKKKGLEEEFDIQLFGVVHTMFKFNSMCDFQYLPTEIKGNKQVSIYNKLLPQGIVSTDWLDQPAPLFLTPPTFSRVDTPQDYKFDHSVTPEMIGKLPKNIISRTRQPRSHFPIFHAFKDGDVPTKCLPEASVQLKQRILDTSPLESLKGLFKERPIWTKNGLTVKLTEMSLCPAYIKHMLPVVSFYFSTGPWRNLCVRFGYDPRKDSSSWIYQTLDLRIRQAGGFKAKVEAKRRFVSNSYSTNKNVKKVSLLDSSNLEPLISSANDKSDSPSTSHFAQPKLSDDIYILRPGVLPAFRQMFYQYCDIKIPEIQTMVREAIAAEPVTVCSEKYGWIPPGVETKCRNYILNHLKTTIGSEDSSWKDGDMPEPTSEDQTGEGNSYDEASD